MNLRCRELLEQSEIDADIGVAMLDQVLVVNLRIVDIATHAMARHLRGGERSEQALRVGSSSSQP